MLLLPKKNAVMTGRSRRHRRATAAAAVTVSVILASTGCSGGSADGTVELSFTSWDNEDVMAPMIDAFEQENPAISVEVTYVAPPDYISTLQTRLLANTASDVFIINPENKAQIVENNEVLSLTDMPLADVLSPANKTTYSVDDELYGVSVASWGGGVLFNRDLLDKVGFTEPPQSWEEFIELCEELKSAGITPFYEAGDGISVSLLALLGLENEKSGGTMDAEIFSGESSFEEKWTPALETWSELFESEVQTRDVAGLTGDQVSAAFVSGEVAMIGTGTWSVGTVREGAPDMNVGFFAVPGSEGETFWAGAPSPAYAINADTENVEEAEAFLEFMTGAQGSELYNEETASITTTTTFVPVVDDAIEPMVEDVQAGRIYFASVNWPDYQTALSPYINSLIQEFIQGQYSAKELTGLIDDKLASLKEEG